jgi:aminoglycoside phosphotransferase family enzyme/predicted kinase
MNADPQSETLRFLVGLDGGEKVVATHISRVVLGRSRAYKLKRPVVFPYLDFSTPEKRLAMCRREAALNRRLAAELYLGARRVTREADGSLSFDGAGELVDAVVEMRRFPDDALLDARAARGDLDAATIEALAGRIAAFHESAEIVVESGGAAALRRVLTLNAASLRQAGLAPPEEVEAHVARLQAMLAAHAARLDARHAAGKTRHCHGDLILRNICLLDGAPTPFDCIEFSDDIARIDTLYDLAFLLMDLWRVGAPELANVALNRYLDARDETDGLPLLPLFMALRASIRAHVAASQGAREEARGLFELARALTREKAPQIVAIGGYSGSGKSSVAAALAPRLGPPPGARTLNSDRLRKKMFGVAPTQRLPPQAYESAVSAKVYAQMFDEAARVAAAGWPVVVDAVFDRPQSRAEVEGRAKAQGVPFAGFWLDVGLAARLGRVGERRGDASDATADVLLRQAQGDPGEILWRKIAAARTLEAIVAEIDAALRKSSGVGDA